MTPFQRCLAAGKSVMTKLKGETVTYDTGDFEIPVTARIGQTTFRVDTGEQFNMRVRTRDFLIDRTELKHPETGELFRPKEGHRIRELVDEDIERVYECLPVGREQGFRAADTSDVEYRIHTQLVDRIVGE
jgi:hypothetical protein